MDSDYQGTLVFNVRLSTIPGHGTFWGVSISDTSDEARALCLDRNPEPKRALEARVARLARNTGVGWHDPKQMDVDDLTIQAILRHRDVATTRTFYIKTAVSGEGSDAAISGKLGCAMK